NGQGIPQDYAQAVTWFHRAAEQGHAGAMNNLGVMYEFGRGVVQNFVQAHKWYNLAAASYPLGEDRDLSVKNRDRVAAKMTPAQLAEAQRQAREWKPKSAADLQRERLQRIWEERVRPGIEQRQRELVENAQRQL